MSCITVAQLQQKNGIYIKTITQGMEQYHFAIIEGTEEMHYQFLKELMEENGVKDSFADFYYKRIHEDSLSLLKAHLTREEWAVFHRLLQQGHESAPDEEFLITELTPEILELLLHLSYKELLFSTFYFTKTPCSIWSNYQGRFLLFTKEQADKLIEKASKIGITIEN